MVTADQIAVHLVGDYLTQSDWMAQNKTKAHIPAFCHALVYSLGFLVFTPSVTAWLVIFATHLLIDRYRLACYVVWAKNFLGPKTYWKKINGAWTPSSHLTAVSWRTWKSFGLPLKDTDITSIDDMAYVRNLPFSECRATGYPPSTPAWLSVWLLIIADNICHIAINAAALKFL